MMVNRGECEGCGNLVDYLSRDGDLACGDCGGTIETIGKVGVVTGADGGLMPIDDLREQIDEWREWEPPDVLTNIKSAIALDTVAARADELEELIETRVEAQDGPEALAYVYDGPDLKAVVYHPREVERYREETGKTVTLTPAGEARMERYPGGGTAESGGGD